MLKKPEEIRTSSQLRSSNIRGLKAHIVEQFPSSEPYIDQIIPKKATVLEAKYKAPHNHMSIFYTEEGPLFIQISDMTIPHLKLLHKYPIMLKRMQVDEGAIRHVIGGANIMCPGLTSPGGRMEEGLTADIVGIFAENKVHALAVGIMAMDTSAILEVNSGQAIDTLHFLGDGFWQFQPPN